MDNISIILKIFYIFITFLIYKVWKINLLFLLFLLYNVISRDILLVSVTHTYTYRVKYKTFKA